MERKKERSGASKRKQPAEISAKSDKSLFTDSVDRAVSVNEVTLEDQEYQDSTILINATAENDYVDASVQPTVEESSISTSSEVLEISTDLGKFINKKLNDTEKRLILDKGPLKTPGPFPKDPHQDHRSFSETYYVSTSKYGPVDRFWICYSKMLDAAYCQPCWLFASQKNVWCTGIRDWRHLSDRVKQHGSSKAHTEACAVYEAWQKSSTIDKELEDEIRKEASFWRQVLRHGEDLSEEGNHGNFLSIVQLVARYDHVLRQVLDMPKGSTRYLSATIQNEMIECLGTKLEHHLLDQIRASPFFTIIMDTTQDISKVDQLSIVERYAVIVFLGFHAVTKHSAADLVNQVTTLFSEKSLDFKKCVGQGYDGASVMSGAYNGVRKQIKDIQPNAEYVHCASHNLNLVVNDAVRGSIEIQKFFAIIQDLFNFFGNSIKRWDLLSKFTGESEITLKKIESNKMVEQG
ncbi:unnamed protein product [Brassicogethes aeneus]|uniref:DUF4371 domain-containing protein n=1 Tax=Brassicogethes aeneus TaxID=1431903 RepID=A0A9P0B0N1_BRAAE|nr:unnamed protein product [Brassicogethes aeneus]